MGRRRRDRPGSTSQPYCLQRWLRNRLLLILAGLSMSGLLFACNGVNQTSGTGSKPPVEITLVSFAVTRSAYDAIIPKFTARWQQDHQQEVIVSQSYGASGAQTRAVIDGLDADIVHLALALDVNRIEKAGLIQPGWSQEFPDNSIVSRSVGVIVTRAGNPKGIRTWADLARQDITFITADPKTSGVARWNFLVLWGSAIAAGKSEPEATEFIRQAYRNVPVLAKDAREATDVFYKQGQADALINYENEAILAAQKGFNLPYIVPAVNISIDNPIAIVDKNVDRHGNREVVQAFVQFLFTPEAQQEFARVGFRPITAIRASLTDKSIAPTQSPNPSNSSVKTLMTAQDLGGWNTIQQQFFADGALFDQIYQGQ